MSASDSLVWLLVKDNNCFLRKAHHTRRAGAVQFSAEPGNLMAANCFKYSGIANNKTIDLSVKDQTVQMTLKAPKKAGQPRKNSVKIPLRKNDVHSLKTIKNRACSNFYRADLAGAAAARYMRLYRDVRIKKGLQKAARSKGGRNSRKE